MLHVRQDGLQDPPPDRRVRRAPHPRHAGDAGLGDQRLRVVEVQRHPVLAPGAALLHVLDVRPARVVVSLSGLSGEGVLFAHRCRLVVFLFVGFLSHLVSEGRAACTDRKVNARERERERER